MSDALFNPGVEPQAGAPERLAPEAVPPGLAAMLRSPAATEEERAHADVVHSARLLVFGVLGAELTRLDAAAVAASPILRRLLDRVVAQVRSEANPLLADPVLDMARNTLEQMAVNVNAAHLATWAALEAERANQN